MNDVSQLDHWRENWKAQLEGIAVYFPDETAMTDQLHDVDAQIVLCIAFKTAQQLIAELEQRVTDLETILKAVNEPITRPSPLEELGHVNALDMLQRLDTALRDDVKAGVDKDVAGIRRFNVVGDEDTVKALVKRGYAASHTTNVWITSTGVEYLRDLKHEFHK